jgi:hypothetical protein
MSMRIKREGDWIKYTAEGGKTFYYNEKTCSFQWEDPFITRVPRTKITVEASPKGIHQPFFSSTSEHAHKSLEQSSDKNSIFEQSIREINELLATPVIPLHQREAAALAKHHDGVMREETTDWKPYLDEATGHYFWYNHVTKVSQWENPFEQQSHHYYDSQAHGGSGDQQHHDEHEVIAVYHDDDLGI